MNDLLVGVSRATDARRRRIRSGRTAPDDGTIAQTRAAGRNSRLYGSLVTDVTKCSLRSIAAISLSARLPGDLGGVAPLAQADERLAPPVGRFRKSDVLPISGACTDRVSTGASTTTAF